ncbi:MAG: hypothetical protein ACK5RL_09270 [Acidimicrobiales bacterium]
MTAGSAGRPTPDQAPGDDLRRRLKAFILAYGLVGLAVTGLAVAAAINGDRAGATALMLSVATALWWSWPSRGPHVDLRDARSSAGPDDLIVYWRPGCTVCSALSVRSRLTSWPAGSRRIKVNVWRDPEASAAVQSLRDGNETVPTVVDASGRLIDANPEAMKAALGRT